MKHVEDATADAVRKREPSALVSEPGDIGSQCPRSGVLDLDAFLVGRVCIVGVGNRQRGDDGAGPRLVDERKSESQGVWLDAGAAPENFLEPIVRTRPDSVLIVDAVDFGGFAGEYRLLEPADVDSVSVSTHTGSLRLLSEYLTNRSGARVLILAIQPERIGPGECLSRAVEESVVELANLLADLLATRQQASCSIND